MVSAVSTITVNTIASAASLYAVDSTDGKSSASSTLAAESGLYSGLTDLTKQKLQALGVDTSNITTESEGKRVLVNEQEDASRNSIQYMSLKKIKNEVLSLAARMGIGVAANEKVSTTFSKISSAMGQLNGLQNLNSDQQQKIAAFMADYQSVRAAFSSIQSQENRLTNSTYFLSMYNREALGF